ncbi:MAG: response regulator [Candidatus Zixiibacteriota bacterium]
MKILVVDDEEVIRTLAESILKKEHHEVLLAKSGEDGLKLLSETSGIELVLLDLNLPDISGPEVLKRMRAVSPSLPCIFSTGQIFNRNYIPEELHPHTHFLQKPYRPGHLLKKIGEILELNNNR